MEVTSFMDAPLCKVNVIFQTKVFFALGIKTVCTLNKEGQKCNQFQEASYYNVLVPLSGIYVGMSLLLVCLYCIIVLQGKNPHITTMRYICHSRLCMQVIVIAQPGFIIVEKETQVQQLRLTNKKNLAQHSFSISTLIIAYQ